MQIYNFLIYLFMNLLNLFHKSSLLYNMTYVLEFCTLHLALDVVTL